MMAQVTSRPAAAHHLLLEVEQEVVRRVRNRRIERVRDHRHTAQPLDIVALACGAHMSAGHLSRQFRLAHGESP